MAKSLNNFVRNPLMMRSRAFNMGWSEKGINKTVKGRFVGFNALPKSGLVAWYDETSIEDQGTGIVQSWNNKGSGGSAFNMDVVVGTAANLTVQPLGKAGKNVVNAAGLVQIETAVSQSIPLSFTYLFVGETAVLSSVGGLGQTFVGGRAVGTEDPRTLMAATDLFSTNAGLNLGSFAADTLPHIHTVINNGDITSLYEVSGIGSINGDMGIEPFGFGGAFALAAGGQIMAGWIGEYCVYNRALTATELLQAQSYLTEKWL